MVSISEFIKLNFPEYDINNSIILSNENLITADYDIFICIFEKHTGTIEERLTKTIETLTRKKYYIWEWNELWLDALFYPDFAEWDSSDKDDCEKVVKYLLSNYCNFFEISANRILEIRI